jgi:hypothetical protein
MMQFRNAALMALHPEGLSIAVMPHLRNSECMKFHHGEITDKRQYSIMNV